MVLLRHGGEMTKSRVEVREREPENLTEMI